MTDWCTCNKLRETEAALMMACKELEDAIGTCPAVKFGWELPRCETDCHDDYAECWREAFVRRARRDA